MNGDAATMFVLNASAKQRAAALLNTPMIPVQNQNKLEDVQDFSRVCRICATVTEMVLPIFSGEGQENNLADKINKHLPIKVRSQDELPRTVCYQCAHTVLAWHELVACAEQADRALRTRRRQLGAATAAASSAASTASAARTVTRSAARTNQDIKPLKTEVSQTDKKEERQFEEFVDFVEPAVPPPRYDDAAYKICEYCSTRHTVAGYKQHVEAHHADLVFHCAECDNMVNRREFVVHMLEHDNQSKLRKQQQAKDENANTTAEERKPAIANLKPEKPAQKGNKNENRTLAIANLKTEKPAQKVKNENRSPKVSANEFSDHSDAEDGFGPLPESVFEAIEDSREAPPTAGDAGISGAPPERKTPAKKTKSRTCPVCAKVYRAASSYFYHMKYSHKTTKEHECSTCGRKFNTKSCLNQHMSVHSETPAFECTDCGKKFQSNASLYIHRQIHSGVKLHACAQCGLAFRWRAQLARHLRRHAPERRHACARCARAFAVRCDLLRHQRTHAHQEHACHKCGRKFAQPRYLKVHLQKIHSTPKKDK